METTSLFMNQRLKSSPSKIFRSIEPFISFEIETSQYILKTLNKTNELREVLQLRAEIFTEEYNLSLQDPTLDVDSYDFNCDHLIIIHKESQKIIGTYRLLCSTFNHPFYSESEFSIDSFLSTPSIKLELGRACIHKNFRKGSILSLLWRGVTTYAEKCGATLLFGCSSVKIKNFNEAKTLYLELLLKNQISHDFNIHPLEKYQIPHFEKILPSEQLIEMPPLLKSYLKAGAEIIAPPAYDSAFHCIDLLTTLDLEKINKHYERRYQK